MNPLDRIIDAFSTTNLKQRVWAVVAFGMLICAASAAGGFFFLASKHARSIEGTGQWAGPESDRMEVRLAVRDIALVHPELAIAVSFSAADGTPISVPVSVEAVDPDTGVLDVTASGVSAPLRRAGRFTLTLVLYKKPYWQFLWGEQKSADASAQ